MALYKCCIIIITWQHVLGCGDWFFPSRRHRTVWTLSPFPPLGRDSTSSLSLKILSTLLQLPSAMLNELLYQVLTMTSERTSLVNESLIYNTDRWAQAGVCSMESRSQHAGKLHAMHDHWPVILPATQYHSTLSGATFPAKYVTSGFVINWSEIIKIFNLCQTFSQLIPILLFIYVMICQPVVVAVGLCPYVSTSQYCIETAAGIELLWGYRLPSACPGISENKGTYLPLRLCLKL